MRGSKGHHQWRFAGMPMMTQHGSFVIIQGIRTKKPIFLWFFRGGGGLDPLSPIWICAWLCNWTYFSFVHCVANFCIPHNMVDHITLNSSPQEHMLWLLIESVSLSLLPMSMMIIMLKKVSYGVIIFNNTKVIRCWKTIFLSFLASIN